MCKWEVEQTSIMWACWLWYARQIPCSSCQVCLPWGHYLRQEEHISLSRTCPACRWDSQWGVHLHMCWCIYPACHLYIYFLDWISTFGEFNTLEYISCIVWSWLSLICQWDWFWSSLCFSIIRTTEMWLVIFLPHYVEGHSMAKARSSLHVKHAYMFPWLPVVFHKLNVLPWSIMKPIRLFFFKVF